LPYFSLLVDQAFHPEASAKLRSPLSAAAEDLYWDDSVVTASSGCGGLHLEHFFRAAIL